MRTLRFDDAGVPRAVKGPLDDRFFLLPRHKQIALMEDDIVAQERDHRDTVLVRSASAVIRTAGTS